jgi:hypothetical protein
MDTEPVSRSLLMVATWGTGLVSAPSVMVMVIVVGLSVYRGSAVFSFTVQDVPVGMPVMVVESPESVFAGTITEMSCGVDPSQLTVKVNVAGVVGFCETVLRMMSDPGRIRLALRNEG